MYKFVVDDLEFNVWLTIKRKEKKSSLWKDITAVIEAKNEKYKFMDLTEKHAALLNSRWCVIC
jgi:hypothetical protein